MIEKILWTVVVAVMLTVAVGSYGEWKKYKVCERVGGVLVGEYNGSVRIKKDAMVEAE